LKEYIKALVQLKLFDDFPLHEFYKIISKNEITNNADVSAAEAPPSAPNVNKVLFGASNQRPIAVEVINYKDSKLIPLLRLTILVGGILAVIWIIFGGSSDEKMAIPFQIPDAHTQIQNVDIRFDDVKGCDESKEELKEVVEYLKSPKKFSKLGARLPKGVLLVGEPGTGKTLLARAIAGEAGVPFLYCSGSSFDELFVGVGPRRIRNLFEDAKKLAPCIIFIDEIDAIGTSRKRSLSASYSKENTLNQLLTELDGFKPTKGIIVIGATNLPEALDPALVRPGRFDKQIVVSVPDVKGRKDIIDLYLKKTVFGPDVDSLILARGTPGFTGADLSNVVNLAAIKATIQNKSFVEMKDLEEAKDDVIMGIKRKGFSGDAYSRKVTAYHEGGHALVALFTEGSIPLHKATIIQRGSALGMTVQLPENDMVSFSRKQMLAKLSCMMGGRAAEEVIFGEQDVTSGASSDFKQATRLAYNMVTRWGMSSKVGNIYHEELEKMSDEQRKLVDEEVSDLLQKAYINAKDLLKRHEQELHRLASALLDFETLSAEEIKQVISGHKLNKKL